MSCDHRHAGHRVAKPAERLPAMDLGTVRKIILLVPIRINLRFVPDILNGDGGVRHPDDLLLSRQEGVDVVEGCAGRRDPVHRELENPRVVDHRERAEGLRVHVVALAGALEGCVRWWGGGRRQGARLAGDPPAGRRRGTYTRQDAELGVRQSPTSTVGPPSRVRPVDPDGRTK